MDADVNIQNNQKATPMHFAAYNNHLEVMNNLKQGNAKLDMQDEFGNTPLHVAAYCGHLDAVKMLVDCGANTQLTNKDGKTAQCLAKESSYPKIAELSGVALIRKYLNLQFLRSLQLKLRGKCKFFLLNTVLDKDFIRLAIQNRNSNNSS